MQRAGKETGDSMIWPMVEASFPRPMEVVATASSRMLQTVAIPMSLIQMRIARLKRLKPRCILNNKIYASYSTRTNCLLRLGIVMFRKETSTIWIFSDIFWIANREVERQDAVGSETTTQIYGEGCKTENTVTIVRYRFESCQKKGKWGRINQPRLHKMEQWAMTYRLLHRSFLYVESTTPNRPNEAHR